MIANHPIESVPFQGGMISRLEAPQLLPGQYSSVQNMRGRHPGLEKRKGQAALHTVADGTDRVLSLYGFSKGRRTENHLLAQMSDGDVLDAAAIPPTVTTGAFGTEILDGSAGQIAGSWANLMDNLLHSNGVDQHKLWPGTLNYVGKFIVYDSNVALPYVPQLGKDYTDEVTDEQTTTYAVLGGLGTDAATDCVCIWTPLLPNSIKFTVHTANTNDAVINFFYWNGAWTALTETDGTSVTGKTLAQTGTVTWTAPTDALPHFMYGRCGYWLKITFSAALSATTYVSKCEYTGPVQDLANIWDGILIDAVEAQVYTAADTVYKTYGGAAIIVSDLTTSDVIYVACADKAEALYIDVGQTPNTTASTTINTVSRWNGTAWESVGSFTDGTSGLSKTGWINLPRSTTEQPQIFNNTQYYAYWYKLTVDKTLSSNLVIWIQSRPYFDISELGRGQCCASWKGRGVYSFTLYPDYLYITAQGNPTGLNGRDFGIIQVGDGRAHEVTAMRKFHNELMVWQEEKGEEGGCLTLIEGYSPATYGKLLLSSRLGAMNANCVAVVDGVLTSTATDEVIKTLAFALSRYGVYMCDGMTCSMISDDVSNYFDPTRSECIRRGYEQYMWLAYDSAYDVIRVGLVSGSSATLPNVFLVYDLRDKVWSVDSLGQELSCAIEIGAGSGDVPVVQVGGGIDDGTVYLLNTGTNDVSTAISSHVQVEFTNKGGVFTLREFQLQCDVQAAGDITVTPYLMGIAQTALTLSMTVDLASRTSRRHVCNLNLVGHHSSLRFAHATASQTMLLENYGVTAIEEPTR